MTWQLLLGIIIGLVTGVVANLLTPLVPTLWTGLRRWQRVGYRSQIQQQVKVAQVNLDHHVRLMVGSPKDLFLYLFRWLLAILAVFILAAACAFLSVALVDVTDVGRADLRTASLFCLMVALVMSGVIMDSCRHLTDGGMQKHKKDLDANVAKLISTLPPV